MFISLYLGCPLAAVASDLTAGVYLQIPLGPGQPFYGLQAGWQPSLLASDGSAGMPFGRPGEPPGGAVMEWRRHLDGSHELWMNGTRLVQTDTFYADDGPAGSETNSEFDVKTVAAILVGAALVAAIANADSVTGCIGTACPPPEDRKDAGE